MKTLKTFLFVISIPFFVFCTPQKAKNTQNKNIRSADLIGKWNQVNRFKTSEAPNPRVEYFHIVNDSIVEFQIVESNEKRKISGTWENGFTKKIGTTNMKFTSDIKLNYNSTDNHRHILLLNLGEEDGKTIMTANKYKFEKEEK